MIVTYEIKNGVGKIKEDCKAFVLGAVDGLTLKVEGANIPQCFVYLENGDKQVKFSVTNLDEITVPSELLVAGEIKFTIAQFTRTKVKTINCEPITLISEDEGLSGSSAFDSLKARVETLEAQVNSLLPLLNEMNELHQALEQ